MAKIEAFESGDFDKAKEEFTEHLKLVAQYRATTVELITLHEVLQLNHSRSLPVDLLAALVVEFPEEEGRKKKNRAYFLCSRDQLANFARQILEELR